MTPYAVERRDSISIPSTLGEGVESTSFESGSPAVPPQPRPRSARPSGPTVDQVIQDTIAAGALSGSAGEKLEEPFYVVEVEDILRKHARWQQLLPRVRPYYAVKCNSCPVVLETLAALGTGFDCASKNEIDTVLAMGIKPSRIIYANPCKTRSFIRHAAQTGVDLMTFDNGHELIKVAENFPDARLVLRIKVDDSKSVCQFSAKFGADPADAELLLSQAKSLGLTVVGVSFHVGSGCESASQFSDAIASARQVFSVAQELGYKFTLLDLGGGYPGTSNAPVPFDAIAAAINSALQEHFPTHDQNGDESTIQIIAEPGRYYVASAFTLAANVIAKRSATEDVNQPQAQEGGNSVMYYLNDGVYGSFNCTIFDHWDVFPEAFLSREVVESRPKAKSILWGPTCDSMDKIKDAVVLPDMAIGEWIVFREMGAYTIAAASTFNGFALPRIRYLLSDRIYAALGDWPRLRRLVLQDLDNATAAGHPPQVSGSGAERRSSRLANLGRHLTLRSVSVPANQHGAPNTGGGGRSSHGGRVIPTSAGTPDLASPTNNVFIPVH